MFLSGTVISMSPVSVVISQRPPVTDFGTSCLPVSDRVMNTFSLRRLPVTSPVLVVT